MKVGIISDLHYDKKRYKSVDEPEVWDGLLNFVDYHKPDLLIHLRDWGGVVKTFEASIC
ncbi:MAG: hypothetical protein GSR74_03185 [Desulfurococcales archaeon]|nr:hypothetical protein [Desulfurococcales archaeon]